MSNMESALNAMMMYNLICDVEDRLASGEEIDGLDTDLLNKTKDLSSDILEDTLNIKVS